MGGNTINQFIMTKEGMVKILHQFAIDHGVAIEEEATRQWFYENYIQTIIKDEK